MKVPTMGLFSDTLDQVESLRVWKGGTLRRRFQTGRFDSNAPVAQMDRAADFESVGREFEPPQARQLTLFLSYS